MVFPWQIKYNVLQGLCLLLQSFFPLSENKERGNLKILITKLFVTFLTGPWKTGRDIIILVDLILINVIWNRNWFEKYKYL